MRAAMLLSPPSLLIRPRGEIRSSLRGHELLLWNSRNLLSVPSMFSSDSLTRKSTVQRPGDNKKPNALCRALRQCRSGADNASRSSQDGNNGSLARDAASLFRPSFTERHKSHSPSNPQLYTRNYSTHRIKALSRSSKKSQDHPSSKHGLSLHNYSAAHSVALDNSILETSAPPSSSSTTVPPPLSILPLRSLLRSIVISTVSSSPLLLPPSLKIMSILAHSHSRILSPDRNPVLKWFLNHTFYAQFCAGENAAEVANTVRGLKEMGCKGVMLCYAKEADAVVKSQGQSGAALMTEEAEIEPWKLGTLKTVSITEPGDFVALKFTGAGSTAIRALAKGQAPSSALSVAIQSICALAAKRRVRLLFDAEHAALQPGVDSWTVECMRKNNKSAAVIYSTYQAYLKSCPAVLAAHLTLARDEGWVLGVKLVRGAYLASDPRDLIWGTKAETDVCYDELAEAVLRKRWSGILGRHGGTGAHEDFPEVSLVLAGHNAESARKAMHIRGMQAANGEKRIEMVYAQLQGMADDVSCELVLARRSAEIAAERETWTGVARDAPEVYKYLVWGTTGQCMKYLLRRAQENKDAVGRTREGRDAMIWEVARRVKSHLGL